MALSTVLAGSAELEADLTKERQLEGIAAAIARGVNRNAPGPTRRTTKVWCMRWHCFPAAITIISRSMKSAR